jgi:hypothetical protein
MGRSAPPRTPSPRPGIFSLPGDAPPRPDGESAASAIRSAASRGYLWRILDGGGARANPTAERHCATHLRARHGDAIAGILGDGGPFRRGGTISARARTPTVWGLIGLLATSPRRADRRVALASSAFGDLPGRDPLRSHLTMDVAPPRSRARRGHSRLPRTGRSRPYLDSMVASFLARHETRRRPDTGTAIRASACFDSERRQLSPLRRGDDAMNEPARKITLTFARYLEAETDNERHQTRRFVNGGSSTWQAENDRAQSAGCEI